MSKFKPGDLVKVIVDGEVRAGTLVLVLSNSYKTSWAAHDMYDMLINGKIYSFYDIIVKKIQ